MYFFLNFSGLVWLLALNVYIFVLGFISFFYTVNCIRLLVNIEVIILTLNLNFVVFSFLVDDVVGQVFVIFILSIAAAESAVGLSLFVLYYRICGTLSVYSLFQYLRVVGFLCNLNKYNFYKSD